MKRRSAIFAYFTFLFLIFFSTSLLSQTNIAPKGKAYYWYGMSKPTGNKNKTATTIINDGLGNTTLNCNPNGEVSNNLYEGAGVIFTNAKDNITSVAFVNGPLDSYGNGNFEANLELQVFDGNTWSNVPNWTINPPYPYNSSAAGKTYTFTGPALNKVLGIRIVGQVRVTSIDQSWSWTVNQVMIYKDSAPDFAITTNPATQSVKAGASTSYTISVTPQNGFTGTVSLSLGSLPTGVTGTFTPTTISGGSGTSTLKINTAPTTSPGSYTLNVNAVSGSLSHKNTPTLTVTSSTSVANWMGFNWIVDPNGEPIGGGLISSNSNNLFVDANGYLHVKISKNGSTWTGAEMFTQQNYGFGTYQWVLQGNNFYQMDPPIVLGLFNYGPQNGIGTDGTNEIDIEFSQWGQKNSVNIDFTVYPATGHKNPGSAPSSDVSYWITPPTTATSTTTVRFVWHSTSISWYIMSGTVGINSAPTNVLKSYTYNGTTATIPQSALPIAINFWSFETLPTNPWEVIIQSFSYLP